MKRVVIALACLALSLPCLAQHADDPASKDDVILYLRTMHSHDLLQKMMEAQAQSMQQLFHDMILKDRGKLPPDFDAHFKVAMADLIKNMPSDQVVEAMIPTYQKHFTHGDIEAMNAFYSSPVGQKVLQELPAVMQDGNQVALPIMSKYLGEWQERMKNEFEDMKPAPEKAPAKPAQK